MDLNGLMDLIREEIERERREMRKDKKHKPGVWYPASDLPEVNIYNIVLCVSGKWANNITYHHAMILDDENAYENGRWYIKGFAQENMTVHGYMIIPEFPETFE